MRIPIRVLLTFGAAALVVAGGIIFHLAGKEPGPLVTINEPSAVGLGQVALDVAVDSVGTKLTRFDVTLDQQGQVFPVFQLSAPGAARFAQETADRMRITHTLPAGSFKGLRDGTARVVVTATRQVLYGLRSAETVASRDVKVRITPPSVAVVSTHHYVTLGGAEMVVYRVSPPDAGSGVMVGDRVFPGYPASGVNAAKQGVDPALRVAFFGLLFDQDVTTPIRLFAKDDAGNTVTAEFDHKALGATFDRRRVMVDDTFLERVVPEIARATPDLNLPAGTPDERLQAFLVINGDLRRRNEARIQEVSRGTSPELLWRGPFLRMGRASSEAVFADHRTYVYGKREIDAQVHLGADLASTRRAPVKAANTGRVLFAGFLGIYGNCVILDHGMGVQSLYAHLSSADVEAGDRLERGEVLGRSGSTGLAGGDHLHFTMLVGGRPVNPVEWWDPHWVADRITRKFADAGLTDGTSSRSAATAAGAGAAKKRTPAAGAKKKPAAKKPAPAGRSRQ